MNPATALSTVLVDELVRCGLTDVVLAPGSRSAPLALAVHEQSRVRLHVRIDERSAAFLLPPAGLAQERVSASSRITPSSPVRQSGNVMPNASRNLVVSSTENAGRFALIG